MDALLENIICLIGSKHGAKKELADYLGISQNVFTSWIAGKSKSYSKYAPKIADYYGVSLDWLCGNSDDKRVAKKPVEKVDELPKNAIAITGMVPILGSIPAGYPALVNEEILGYAPVTVSDPKDCFYLKVKGDSMINAGIHPGDLVLICRQPCAENGQIVACRVNGDEATLKRFRNQGDSVILLPENPAYEPRIVSMQDFETGEAAIIGVAIQVLRNL